MTTETFPAPNYSDLELDYKSIGGVEKWREYDFGGGRIYRVEEPLKLCVNPVNGSHRLIDSKMVRHYVPSGWIAFRFDGQWVF